jgi:hypothetical protein
MHRQVLRDESPEPPNLGERGTQAVRRMEETPLRLTRPSTHARTRLSNWGGAGAPIGPALGPMSVWRRPIGDQPGDVVRPTTQDHKISAANTMPHSTMDTRESGALLSGSTAGSGGVADVHRLDASRTPAWMAVPNGVAVAKLMVIDV